jgi:putative DNA methylase
LSPIEEHERVANEVTPNWKPEYKLSDDRRAIYCPLYGLDTFDKLFTSRQLLAITTICNLIDEARNHIAEDAKSSGLSNDSLPLNSNGIGAQGYAEALSTYLALALDKMIARNNSLCPWEPAMGRLASAFGMQTISMKWDFAETNPFAGAGGDFLGSVMSLCEVLRGVNATLSAKVNQRDAMSQLLTDKRFIYSTDPPYYDNIGYSDLSDFFYIWLRRSIGNIHPQLFSTILTPKSQELVAAPHRFNGNKEKAREFFEDGLNTSFSIINSSSNQDFPLTIYYAFKQSEADERGKVELTTVSTGWETMLSGLLNAGFLITGTWPMRTEQPKRMRDKGANALASSIILVCRPRQTDAPMGTRKEFITAMKRELPEALRQLQKGNIAPVDLAQAAIGPGMSIFSRYSKVLEADGNSMRVRTALQLINQHLDEYLSEQEGEYDPDTRWALSWYEQYGVKEGPFGDAETLSKAKNISVEGLVQSGILKAGGGKVRLLRRDELDPDWDPATDKRLSVWEMTQHLIRILESNGEDAATELQSKLGGSAEIARDLAYRLYAVCEKKGWAQEAISYNGLVTA